MSEVIHNLQTERDMTAFYLSSFSPLTKSDLVERYLKTNDALSDLSNWPVAIQEMRNEFKTKENFVYYINQYRHEQGVYEYEPKPLSPPHLQLRSAIVHVMQIYFRRMNSAHASCHFLTEARWCHGKCIFFWRPPFNYMAAATL